MFVVRGGPAHSSTFYSKEEEAMYRQQCKNARNARLFRNKMLLLHETDLIAHREHEERMENEQRKITAIIQQRAEQEYRVQRAIAYENYVRSRISDQQDEFNDLIRDAAGKINAGAYPAAINAYTAIIRKYITSYRYSEDYKLTAQVKADIYLTRGQVLLFQREYQQAIADFTSSLSYSSEDYQAFKQRGIAMMLSGLTCRDEDNSISTAAQDFTKSLTLHTDQNDVRGYLAFVNNNWKDVLRWLSPEINKTDDSKQKAEFSRLCGIAKSNLNRHAEAVDYFTQAINDLSNVFSNYPLFELLYFLRGKEYLSLHRANAAYADFEKIATYNTENPFVHYREAVGGDPTKAEKIGAAYYEGTAFVSKDYAKASEWYVRANTPPALNQLGRIYQFGGNGITRNLATALEYYVASAASNTNYAAASYNAAVLLRDGGTGITVNPNESLRYFLRAYEAPQEQLTEEYRLRAANSAACYYSGQLGNHAVTENLERAAQLFTVVADSPNADVSLRNNAALSLGRFYLRGGTGIAINLTLAHKYLKQATDAHIQEANPLWAECLYQIANGATNQANQIENYKTASRLGHVQAAFKLGKLYYEGHNSGIEKNRNEAITYLTLARDRGVAEAAPLLDNVSSFWAWIWGW